MCVSLSSRASRGANANGGGVPLGRPHPINMRGGWVSDGDGASTICQCLARSESMLLVVVVAVAVAKAMWMNEMNWNGRWWSGVLGPAVNTTEDRLRIVIPIALQK